MIRESFVRSFRSAFRVAFPAGICIGLAHAILQAWRP